MQNPIKYFVLLHAPVVLEDLRCVVEVKELPTHVIPLFILDFCDCRSCLSPQMLVQSAEGRWVRQLRSVQKWSSPPTDLAGRLRSQLGEAGSIHLTLSSPEDLSPPLQMPLKQLVLREVFQFPLANNV